MPDEPEKEPEGARPAADSSPDVPTSTIGRCLAWVEQLDKQWKALALIGGIVGAGFGLHALWSGVATREDIEAVRVEVTEVQALLTSEDEAAEEARDAIGDEQQVVESRLDTHIAVSEHRLGDLDKDMDSMQTLVRDMVLRQQLLQLTLEQRQASSFSERQQIHQDANTLRANLQPLPQGILSADPKPDAGI